VGHCRVDIDDSTMEDQRGVLDRAGAVPTAEELLELRDLLKIGGGEVEALAVPAVQGAFYALAV